MPWFRPFSAFRSLVPFSDNTAALQADPVRNAQILARIPAGRWGKPEDLAGALIFLSSSASNYVNGTILTVDGGWMGR